MAASNNPIIDRISKFLKDNAFGYYSERIPLKVLYSVDEDPIPFQSLQKRDWQEIMIGEVWGSLWQSAWFRFRASIPVHWKNKEAVAVIDTGSEACLFDSRGVPICGLTSKAGVTDPLYRKAIIPVSSQAEDGETVELLVEAAANNTMGVQEEAKLNDASLAVFRRDFWNLYHDMLFLLDLAIHLQEPEMRQAQILSALNRALNLYRDGKEEDIELCRSELLPELEKKANASSPEISAVGHAHLDVAWLWPLRETVRKAGRTFSSAIYYMQEYPEYRFGASQPQLYQFVKDKYPELFVKIKAAVAQGSWELQGAMWVEPDCNLTGGESLIRQILYGKRFFRDEFGKKVENLWLSDTFGFSPVLPQLMKKSGLKYLMSQKLSWNKINKFPLHTFLWEGLDGSKVFTHFLPADTYNSTLLPGELLYAAGNFREKDQAKRWLCLFGEGDGGGGPGRHHLELARRAQNAEGLPRLTMESARDFFRKAEEDIKDIPEWQGELYLETHRGTLTTRGRTKWHNRRSEYLMHNLEFLLLLNSVLLGSDYPAEHLEQLWKKLLLNQFHDILPGTTIECAFQESSRQFDQLLARGEQLIVKALETFAARLQPGSNTAGTYLIFNTTGFAREQILFLPVKNWSGKNRLVTTNGQGLALQKGKDGIFLECRLPSYGFTTLQLEENGGSVSIQDPVSASRNQLENAKIRVVFSADGSIQSIFDKEENREVLAEGKRANQLLLYRDNLVKYDAWNIDPSYIEAAPEKSELLSTEIEEKGPLCASIVQKRIISESKVTQEIRLYRNSKIIEFKTSIDWKEKQKMLKVAFPLNIHTDSADFDIQFGNIRRANYRNTSWEAAKFEVFAHKWADLSEYGYGAALLNDCKYGYNVYKNTLELTLLRSPIDPDPLADREVHHFTYALLPHSRDFREGQVIPAGYFLNLPPLYFELPASGSAVSSTQAFENQPFFSVDQNNAVIETIKMAEQDNTIIVRVYEAFGMRTDLSLLTPFQILKASETDLLENDMDSLLVEKDQDIYKISFHIKPYEIKTIKLQTPDKS